MSYGFSLSWHGGWSSRTHRQKVRAYACMYTHVSSDSAPFHFVVSAQMHGCGWFRVHPRNDVTSTSRIRVGAQLISFGPCLGACGRAAYSYWRGWECNVGRVEARQGQREGEGKFILFFSAVQTHMPLTFTRFEMVKHGKSILEWVGYKLTIKNAKTMQYAWNRKTLTWLEFSVI